MFSNILDYLDGLYSSIIKHGAFCGKKIICRLILSAIYHLNNLLCWYYHNVKKKKICSPENCDYIVSLTTYPARVGNVWRVIEMAANQKGIKENYAICLYLIESEFDGIELPQEIKELQERGLTVKFNKENLKCHNKYYYAFKDYPEKSIVTIDDDLQYNHHTISGLISKSKEFQKCIIYNYGAYVLKNKPFLTWPDAYSQCSPHIDIYPLGVGGVLYPPHACHELVLKNTVIRETCLCADDMWLNFASRMNKTKVVQTGLKSSYIVLPDSSQQNALWKSNANAEIAGNDKQINAISDWAKKNYGCDFFVNL